jgi:hypothetical protein
MIKNHKSSYLVIFVLTLSIFLVLPVIRAAALPACTSSITACCEITSAGTYTVTTPLTSTDPAGDCIDINAANVNLFDAGNAITGPGGSTATGIGINVMKKAKNAKLLLADPNPSANTGSTFISGFGTGILVGSAPGLVLGGFDTENNAVAGLSLNGAKNCQIYAFDTDSNPIGLLMSGGSGCAIHDFGADFNISLGISLSKVKSTNFYDFNADDTTSGTGIALSGSSSNRLSDFSVFRNSVDGLTLSSGSTKNMIYNFSADNNSDTGIMLNASNSNQIQDFDSYDNGNYGVWLEASNSNTVSYAFTFGNALAGIYLGCSGNGPASMCSSSASSKNTIQGASAGNDGATPQAYGVAVDISDLKNTLTGIGASGDTVTDLLDNNPNCGTNIWALTSAGATSPSSCIQTTP